MVQIWCNHNWVKTAASGQWPAATVHAICTTHTCKPKSAALDSNYHLLNTLQSSNGNIGSPTAFFTIQPMKEKSLHMYVNVVRWIVSAFSQCKMCVVSLSLSLYIYIYICILKESILNNVGFLCTLFFFEVTIVQPCIIT